jgi:hypothetical protein
MAPHAAPLSTLPHLPQQHGSLQHSTGQCLRCDTQGGEVEHLRDQVGLHVEGKNLQARATGVTRGIGTKACGTFHKQGLVLSGPLLWAVPVADHPSSLQLQHLLGSWNMWHYGVVKQYPRMAS